MGAPAGVDSLGLVGRHAALGLARDGWPLARLLLVGPQNTRVSPDVQVAPAARARAGVPYPAAPPSPPWGSRPVKGALHQVPFSRKQAEL